MKFKSCFASTLVAASVAAAALPAVAQHYEGCITGYKAGQMIVCTFASPQTCNIVKLYGGTSIVTAGSSRRARLSRGEYVAVDTRPSSAGVPVATMVQVFPGTEVRTIEGLQPAQAQQVANTLANIPGVRGIRINTQLKEVLINFYSARTTPAAISRAAARGGIHLSIPS